MVNNYLALMLGLDVTVKAKLVAQADIGGARSTAVERLYTTAAGQCYIHESSDEENTIRTIKLMPRNKVQAFMEAWEMVPVTDSEAEDLHVSLHCVPGLISALERTAENDIDGLVITNT